jgi:hypothetical protein
MSSPLAAMLPMIYSFLGAPIVLAVPVWFAITEMADPPIWVPVVVLALVAGGFALAETMGYVTPALPSDTDRDEAKRRAVAIWRAKLMFRFAVTEAPILIGLTLSFVANTRWPFLVGLVAGWPILVYEVFPHRRSIEKLQSRLDSGGASSFLDEALRSPNSSN